MSALSRVRVPLAAFLAAALGGLGLGLALQGEDDPGRAPRAEVGPARTTELPTQDLPATPALRVGTSPAVATPGPVASSGPAAAAPARPDAAAPPPSRPQSGAGNGNGFQVTDESVASP